MAATSGVLSPDVNFADRLVPSLEEMTRVVSHLRGLGYRIVLTSGSFDLIHLGHVKYLARAKELGGILVVGVDSDAKIRRRKGEDRPMVPESERLELLAHQRPVDLIYLKQDEDPKWGLIRAVEPDVLVLTADHSYTPEQLTALEEVVGEVVVLERQSSVTTSERIRQMYMNLGDKLGPKLAEVLPGLIDETLRRG
ncbi:MAG TPA: adenylyltransferase/cytidyltransferase family protein [Baekduia sp.]|uniref:adenylyltransferase/cytidyltransferase family protein n=1 Tax=Baekduia sp. TaxID=2600305 RepID=UPI002D797583|nr:adenylyltransferase/cytidyltransferase family protein [Baekduia sp.]HET6508494.1 adenylyltransferase/cytidyltransferase family protein [Baekduia sp.]